MPIDRRTLLFAAAGAATLASVPHALSAGLSPKPMPLPGELEAGDLLWPKLPGAFVPYDYRADATAEQDFEDWTKRKDALLSELNARDVPEDAAPSLALLKTLSYATFRSIYLQGLDPTGDRALSMDGIAAVGHVAIVDVDSDGVAWVIEALNPQGVVKSKFVDWVTSRPGQIAWQGRLQGRTPDERKHFAEEAAMQLGKPYNFWNFDLADDRNFYCSKLVWLAHWRALHAAIDGNPDPQRWFWLSPKQLLYLPAIKIILDQGDYAFD